MTIYKGSCHCGRVAFEVEGEVDGALSCNCSICRRKGSLLWFVPRDPDPKGTAMAAINLRCLEDFEFGSVPVREFDGRSL